MNAKLLVKWYNGIDPGMNIFPRFTIFVLTIYIDVQNLWISALFIFPTRCLTTTTHPHPLCLMWSAYRLSKRDKQLKKNCSFHLFWKHFHSNPRHNLIAGPPIPSISHEGTGMNSSSRRRRISSWISGSDTVNELQNWLILNISIIALRAGILRWIKRDPTVDGRPLVGSREWAERKHDPLVTPRSSRTVLSYLTSTVPELHCR